MLDKIIIRSKYEAWLIFSNRSPVILRSDVDVLHMIEIVLQPIDVEEVLEDTQVIDLPIAA